RGAPLFFPLPIGERVWVRGSPLFPLAPLCGERVWVRGKKILHSYILLMCLKFYSNSLSF
ncbi:MAG: hypothetical protein NC929_04410, partial [Candidatus Omnitrophica bacterium]|nr:hypothetical protein [Candidatus Omnitrophota bacterium]